MSSNEAPDAPTVWLSVSFDTEQLGSNLAWVATEGRENLYETYGPFAGSLSLPKNCQLRVEVRGYGSKALKGFQVVSAGLITIPAPHTPPLSPSPFTGQQTAIAALDNFPPANDILFDPRIDRAYGISTSPGTASLNIGNEDGAWHLSMVLTVDIWTTADDGAIKPIRRVYRFDPESYVGNGTRP